MREIKLADAKARLSSVLDDAVRGEPAIIMRHGKPEGVILSFAEWQKLSNVPSFGRLLMSAPPGLEELPPRDETPIRSIDF